MITSSSFQTPIDAAYREYSSTVRRSLGERYIEFLDPEKHMINRMQDKECFVGIFEEISKLRFIYPDYAVRYLRMMIDKIKQKSERMKTSEGLKYLLHYAYGIAIDWMMTKPEFPINEMHQNIILNITKMMDHSFGRIVRESLKPGEGQYKSNLKILQEILREHSYKVVHLCGFDSTHDSKSTCIGLKPTGQSKRKPEQQNTVKKESIKREASLEHLDKQGDTVPIESERKKRYREASPEF